jgi:hypothetical protein
MRLMAVVVFMCAAAAAFAQESPLEAPPPIREMAAETDEPAVRIPVQDRDKVEEVRVGGRVVMLKVTPPSGKPYYLVDPGLNRESLDDGMRFPMWPVYLFD